MREILFRGKGVDDGKWIYGWYEMYPFERFPGRPCIIPSESAKDGYYEHVEVDPSTVGQYTGLADKNGAKIYEGDIVQVPFWRSAQSGLTMKGVVEFHRSAFSVLWDHQDYGRDFIGYIRDMEVIGNIHDNPELLEVES